MMSKEERGEIELGERGDIKEKERKKDSRE
jgi:hypothetical protein